MKNTSIYTNSSAGMSNIDFIKPLSVQYDLFMLKHKRDAPNMAAICINPAMQDAMTFPNIIATGFALVIRSSIARELFSDATFVATICPYKSITI